MSTNQDPPNLDQAEDGSGAGAPPSAGRSLASPPGRRKPAPVASPRPAAPAAARASAGAGAAAAGPPPPPAPDTGADLLPPTAARRAAQPAPARPITAAGLARLAAAAAVRAVAAAAAAAAAAPPPSPALAAAHPLPPVALAAAQLGGGPAAPRLLNGAAPAIAPARPRGRPPARNAAAITRHHAGKPSGPRRLQEMGRRIRPTAGGSEWDLDSDHAGPGPAGADAWMMVDGSTSEPEEVRGTLGHAARPPAMASALGGPAAHTPNHPTGLAAARLAALAQLAPSTAAAPAAPATSLDPTGSDQPPHECGLFEAQLFNSGDDFTAIRPPTAAELIGVSESAIRLLFCDRRLSEITRPRTVADDVKAAAALKAQRCLADQGWRQGQLDIEHHAVYYGFQAVFRIGLPPLAAGQLLGWAVPFGIDSPGDISKTADWVAHRATAAALFPRLETAVFAARTPGREYSMPSSLFVQIRKLALAYFSTRARALLPMLARLGASPLHEQAKPVIRAYVAQARDLPVLWNHLENSIVDGALNEHMIDPAIVENAARVSLARPFLTALLSGQTRGWNAAQMITAHQQHIPSATLLHSTDFSQLVLTSAAAAQFALTLPGPPVASPTPPVSTSGQVGHPFQLAYTQPRHTMTPTAPPPAALPPPVTPPPAWTPTATWQSPPTTTKTRVPGASALCIPPSRSIVTSSSPFSNVSANLCDYCKMPSHAQYECPKRFFDSFGRPLPGFLRSGDYDPSAWHNGDLVPAARRAMAAYLAEFHIPTHRKFGVTIEHVASGVAPPPPKP